MDITLVRLPWHALAWPSTGISVLDTALTSHGHRVRQYYANIRFADYLLERTDGANTGRVRRHRAPRLRPRTVGEVLHRRFPQPTYVIGGEGEHHAH